MLHTAVHVIVPAAALVIVPASALAFELAIEPGFADANQSCLILASVVL